MKSARFYFIVAPGLVELALAELREILVQWQRPLGDQALVIQDPMVDVGGFELVLDIQVACLLNLFLKLPSRILLRVTEPMRVRDFPKLHQKLGKLFSAPEWRSLSRVAFLPASAKPTKAFEFVVAAKKSRLNNEKRISAVLEDVLKKQKIELPADLYLRFDDDICTLSLDTTGEHLHFRNYRKEQGAAPLRENFAAALLYFMIQDLSWAELSQIQIVDPMMGSGTFLAEALLWGRGIQGRTISGHISEELRKKVTSSAAPGFAGYFGQDIDPEAVKKAERNLAGICPQAAVSLELKCENLFQGKIWGPEGRRFVVVNPPYGERMQKKEGFDELFDRLVEKFQPERLLILLPERANFSKKADQMLKFSNNGISVVGHLFVKPTGFALGEPHGTVKRT